MSEAPVRVLALWSPDWPVTAAARAGGVPPHRPAAVFVANRVLACSAVARAQGVRRGLRRREAQARCPDLAVLAPDPERDARAFEPVVLAVEELAPGVEVVRPGLVALAAQGPVGYFGGELPAAERLVDQVAARTGVECQVGFADGLFAAVLAARRGLAVAPGDTPAFLAALEVGELDREPEVDRSELVGLLGRLGLRSLGAFAGLDAEDVASRFGADAVLCHRLARGLDPRPPVRRRPPEELTVEIELDPPVDRVDAAAFAARGLAERLHRTLAGHGLSCTRLGVAARTVAGEELHRIWRCAEPLTPSGTVDRVRWQLDAWLTRSARGATGGRPGAVARLRLVPEETVTAGALQMGLWGDVGESDERAGRALVRVQALLGPTGVVTAVLAGGRDPAEQVRLVPWGDERPSARGEPGRAGMVIGGSERGAVSSAAERAEPVITGGGRSWPAAVIGGVERGAVSGAVEGAEQVITSGARSGPEAEIGGSERGAVSSAAEGAEQGITSGARSGPGAVIGGSERGAVSSAVEGAEPVIMGGERSWPAAVIGGVERGAVSSALERAEPVITGGARPGPAAVIGGVERGAVSGAVEGAEQVITSGARSGPEAEIGGSERGTVSSAAEGTEQGIMGCARSGPGAVIGGSERGAVPSTAERADPVITAEARPGAVIGSDRGAAHGPSTRRRRVPTRRSTGANRVREPPPSWPGRLPAPSPATVPPQPLPAELLDADGSPVRLTAPDLLSAPPHRLVVHGDGPADSWDVQGWAGPWPLQQRWWSPDAVVSSRMQVLAADGAAFLLLTTDGRWWVTGIYD